MASDKDLIIRLQAENKQLLKALEIARKEIMDLKKSITVLDREMTILEKKSAKTGLATKKMSSQFLEAISASRDLTTGLAKIGATAGAIGLAAGAIGKITKEALDASNSFMDFRHTIAAVSSSFGTFADAALNFDWKRFTSGIYSANLEFEKLSFHMQNSKTAATVKSAEARLKLDKYQAIMRNQNSTPKEKAAAKKEYMNAHSEATENVKILGDDIRKLIAQSGIKEKTGYTYSDEEVRDVVLNANVYDQFHKMYDSYIKEVNGYTTAGSKEMYRAYVGVEPPVSKKPEPPFKDENIMKRIALAYYLSPESRKEIETYLIDEINQKSSLFNMQKVFEQTNNNYKDETPNGKTKKEIITPGSPDDFKKQIEKKQKELDNTADFEKRVKLKIDIKDLQRQLSVIEENPELFRRLFTDRQPTPTPGVKPVDTSRVESDLGGTIRNIAPILPTIDINKLKDRMDATQEAIKKHEEEVRQLQNTYAGLGNILSDVASNFNSIAVATGSTDAVLQASMHTLMVFGAQLPTLINLMKLFSAETRQEAAAAMLAAVGITLKENSKLGPIIGTVIGLSSIAAVIAAYVSSKNKFAYGGIVPGNSYTGDHILAGLNSGEMVINKRQQANLWKMLNSSYAERTSGAVAGDVRFRLKGTELIGVIENSRRKYAK